MSCNKKEKAKTHQPTITQKNNDNAQKKNLTPDNSGGKHNVLERNNPAIKTSKPT